MKHSTNSPVVSGQEKQELLDWAKKWNQDGERLLMSWERLSQGGGLDALKQRMKRWEEVCKREPWRLEDKRQRRRITL